MLYPTIKIETYLIILESRELVVSLEPREMRGFITLLKEFLAARDYTKKPFRFALRIT